MRNFNRTIHLSLFCGSLSILLLSAATQNSSLAGESKIIPAGMPAAQVQGQKKPFLKNTQNPEFKATHLQKAVELPDMPAYAGKKVEFVTGTMFNNVKGGPSLTMQFAVKDDPKTVLAWYKNTFSQNNWTPLDNMTGINGLAAMKSNNICQVMTLAPTKLTSKCDILVRYKFYKPSGAAFP